MFTRLWNKPQTRDERVKEYIPEVLEESLAEQRRVLDESTSRDKIVEAGHKILREIENKAPTPSIAPHLTTIMLEFGGKDLIGQRALSQLLYPNSSAQAQNELLSGFLENFKGLVEYVEQNGSSLRSTAAGAEANTAEAASGEVAAKGDGAASSSEQGNYGDVITAKAHEVEPMDFTLFVKVTAGMALSNINIGDFNAALRCCDSALKYAVDTKRIGGIYGMKAGILNRLKKFEDAAECARLAIEASDNIQGYLQGASALKALKRGEEVIALLEQAKEAHPHSKVVAEVLLDAKKNVKLALPSGVREEAAADKDQKALP